MIRCVAIGVLIGAFSLTSLVHSESPGPSIVADWTFEEGTAGSDILSVTDRSGNNHILAPLVPRDGIPPGPNAQYATTESTAEGSVSARFAVSAGGKASVLATEQSPAFQLDTSFTIELGLKANLAALQNLEAIMTISTPQNILGINFASSEIWIVGFGSQVSGDVRSPAVLHDRPHHIAFVGQGNTLSIYVDKVLKASGPMQVNIAGDEGARVYLGGSDVAHLGFNGTIDRVRIARTALTPEEFFPHRKTSGLIVEPLVSQTVGAGSRAVLRVGADPSSGPLTYEWTFRPTHEVSPTDRPIEGANTDTLVIDPAERSDDGVYSVRVSNSQGQSSSSKALLSVGRGLPIIQNNPASQTVSPGETVQFTVEAYNDNWMTYAWLFNGVELAGENGPTLVVTNVQGKDAGRYAAKVLTPTWTLVSSDAILTVLGTDTVPPVISITSPASGSVLQTNRITVTGMVTDNVALRSASLEVNGSVHHTFSQQNFSVTGVTLTFGTNIVTIRATDYAGNTSSSSIVVIHAPERYLSVPGDVIAQEGGYVTLPIMFQSAGGVGGIDFYFNYWSNRLSAPKITWLMERPGAQGALISEFGRFRASFNLPAGEALPAGQIELAQIRFKALSLPEPFFALFDPRILEIRSSTGAAFETGNGAFGAGLTVTVREVTADNNANDRLDIGDAAAIRRRLAGLDTLQPYDITGNDLNGDQALDMEDVARVLRTVVDLDSQPQAAAAAPPAAKSLRAAADEAAVRLSADSAEIRPGEKVKVTVRLSGNDSPLEGASFKLEYPASALRLDGAESHTVGPIVPSNASAMWNVAPAQDYQAQSGSIHLAACSGAAWAEPNGTLAEFIFTVQPGASSQQSWPIGISRVELSHEADLQTLAGSELVLATASDLPTLTISSPAVTEADSGTVAATFTVSLSAAGSQTASVAYATANGTALAGEDYTATSGTLIFAPGVLSQTITVEVLGDAATEPSETFEVNLSVPVNATLGTAQGIGTILDNDSNAAPAVAQPEDAVLLEEQAFSMNIAAVDAPGQALVFALHTDAPSGMHIDPNSGLLTWIPSEHQGPSTNTITVMVTDDGIPALSSTTTFSVIVQEENKPPTLLLPESREIEEGASLVLTNHASDQDWPPHVLTFSLGAEAPPGMAIDGETGVLTWTPGELDGPNTNYITVHLTDNGTPPLETNVTFTIAVRELNQKPLLASIADQSIAEGKTLTLALFGTDADLPAQELRFELGPGAPTGMEVNETTGLLNWTPEETAAADPVTNFVSVIVADSGTPELSDTVSFRVVVNKGNQPPVLTPIADCTVFEGEMLTLTNFAHDADFPKQELTFALTSSAPLGMTIDQKTGVLKWTPSEAQGGSTNLVTIRVIDDGSPPMIANGKFLIVAAKTNSAPAVVPIPDQRIVAGQSLTMSVNATDADLPPQNLKFSLGEDAPEGMTIDPTSGMVSWKPRETDGPGRHAVTVIVSDDGTPPKEGSASFAVNISGPPYLKLAIRVEPNHSAALEFEDLEGEWIIEGSANLEDWTEMTTIENGSGSSVTLGGLKNESRFYRGRIRP